MSAIAIGTRVRTLIADEDTDPQGRRRFIPPSTVGTIMQVEGTPDGFDVDAALYDIAWDNGGWTRWSAEELIRDAEEVQS